MKTPIRRFAGAILLLTGVLATTPAAHAEPVDTLNVVTWNAARGDPALNPEFNPFLRDAIRDGLGYPKSEIVFVQIGELTELPLIDADYSFFWVMRSSQELITPLTPEEQAALGDWVRDGGAVFLVFEHAVYGESNLGAPFGLHSIDGLGGDWPVVLDPNTPITDGPFGTIETTQMGGPGWFDQVQLLPGFVQTGWLVTNDELVQGYYDWGELAEGSGVLGAQADGTKLAVVSWREDAGQMVSNFYAYALAGPPCPGDANGDGDVDPLDSGFVLARFGCPVGSGDPNCDAADQNGDGSVDPLDSGFVLARFGECE